MNRPRRAVIARVLLGVAALAAAAAGGCNILGPAFTILHGPPKIPPQYVPQDRPAVVFVDDRANVLKLSAAAIRKEIGESATTELLRQKVFTRMIDAGDAIAYSRAQDRHAKLVPIDVLGREVGAELLIYVELSLFAETPDGVTPRPVASASVKVYDVVNRERLFPDPDEGSGGATVNANLGEYDPQLLNSQATRMQLHRALAVELGVSISKLFYEHQVYEFGDRLDPDS